MRSQMEGSGVRLFQDEGTASQHSRSQRIQRGGAEGRLVSRTGQSQSLTCLLWTIPPVMQPKSHHCIVCICGVCNGQETLNASLEWCSDAQFLLWEDTKARRNPVLCHIFLDLKLKVISPESLILGSLSRSASRGWCFNGWMGNSLYFLPSHCSLHTCYSKSLLQLDLHNYAPFTI